MKNLTSILESILFVSGNEVCIDDIAEKLNAEPADVAEAAQALQSRYCGESGIHLLYFNGKLQLSSNPANVDYVSAVLNPIREKELTKAMLETLAIIAYKQPITRLEVEEVRGVDCNYALQTLLKLKMIRVLGRKDAVGKPLLFGTTDDFLKRFNLEDIDDLPNYEKLLERIQTLDSMLPNTDLYNSNRDMNYDADEDIPEFLSGEAFDIIDED